jgi:hypothetical protein
MVFKALTYLRCSTKKVSFIVFALLLSLPLVSLQGAGKPQIESPSHHCTDDAIERAHRLLELHVGPDNRIAIEQKAKLLAPLKNPVGKNYYDVIEVWGHLYRADYRMRFIYFQFSDECVLVGQEILEYAKE